MGKNFYSIILSQVAVWGCVDFAAFMPSECYQQQILVDNPGQMRAQDEFYSFVKHRGTDDDSDIFASLSFVVQYIRIFSVQLDGLGTPSIQGTSSCASATTGP